MRSLFTRDEREAAVEQGGDPLAYIVVSYGLLLIVAYHSFVEHQASWDLLALVVVGGIVSVVYRMWRRGLSRNALVLAGLTIAIAVAFGALVALGVRA
jgi:predicted Kef-type K+ transport protein